MTLASGPTKTERSETPELPLLRAALARGPLRLRAGGHSMRPTLRPGDELRIEAREARDVVLGDIVLADVGGRPVLHRVVRRRPAGWKLIGDARIQADGWVAPGDVLGVAVERGPRLGEARPVRLASASARGWGWLRAACLRPARRWERLRRARDHHAVPRGAAPSGSRPAKAGVRQG